LTRQNASPLGLQQVWTLPDTGLIDGVAAGEGQDPDYFLTGSRVLQRG
jgi:hypothetical protein